MFLLIFYSNSLKRKTKLYTIFTSNEYGVIIILLSGHKQDQRQVNEYNRSTYFLIVKNNSKYSTVKYCPATIITVSSNSKINKINQNITCLIINYFCKKFLQALSQNCCFINPLGPKYTIWYVVECYQTVLVNMWDLSQYQTTYCACIM